MNTTNTIEKLRQQGFRIEFPKPKARSIPRRSYPRKTTIHVDESQLVSKVIGQKSIILDALNNLLNNGMNNRQSCIHAGLHPRYAGALDHCANETEITVMVKNGDLSNWPDKYPRTYVSLIREFLGVKHVKGDNVKESERARKLIAKKSVVEMKKLAEHIGISHRSLREFLNKKWNLSSPKLELLFKFYGKTN